MKSIRQMPIVLALAFCAIFARTVFGAECLVAVKDLAGAQYPVVELVDNEALVLADESVLARFDRALIPYEILDADPRTGLYVFAHLNGEAVEKLGEFGTIVRVYSGCVLIKTDENRVPELNRLKIELSRLSMRPINAFSPIIPPEPQGVLAPDTLIQKMVTAVSQDSIRASILKMQRMYTRYATTDTNKTVLVNWIRDRLIAYGYDSVYFEQFETSYGPNVIAIKRGEVYTNWNRYCVIDGHIDDVPSTGYAPGADDNASGTTAMLEAARVMKDYNFENTIRFIGFNAEEQGLIGSAYNATNAHNAGDTILGVLNYDMIGYVTSANRDTMNCHYSTAVPGCSLFVCQWFQAVADTYTQLKIRRVRNTGTSGGSDHVSYWQNGYKALCGIERVLTPMYHTIGDTIGPYMYTNCGVNNLPFATKVIQTGVAALAKLAVPIHSGTVVEEQNAGAVNVMLSVWPNPFHRNLNINFEIRNPKSEMSLQIYDASGRLVKSFNLLTIEPFNQVVWSGTDQNGRLVPAGVYFIKLEAGGQAKMEKAILLR